MSLRDGFCRCMKQGLLQKPPGSHLSTKDLSQLYHSYACLYKQQQQGTRESWEHRGLLCCLVLSGESILTSLSILTFLTIQNINRGNSTFLQYLVFFLKNCFIHFLLVFLKEKCEELETKWPCSQCGFAFGIDSQCDSELQSPSDFRTLSWRVRALK